MFFHWFDRIEKDATVPSRPSHGPFSVSCGKEIPFGPDAKITIMIWQDWKSWSVFVMCRRTIRKKMIWSTFLNRALSSAVRLFIVAYTKTELGFKTSDTVIENVQLHRTLWDPALPVVLTYYGFGPDLNRKQWKSEWKMLNLGGLFSRY